MLPGAIPSPQESAVFLAAQALVIEFFSRVDRRDLDGAVALYAKEAVFLGVRGRTAIRETMVRGLASNADKSSRHVIANVRSSIEDGGVLVEYTALAYTLDGPGPFAARSVLDQEMSMRRAGDGRLHIVEHRILGYELTAPDEPDAIP